LCLSNSTQLGKAAMVYTQDYHDSYPDAMTYTDQAGEIFSDEEGAPYGLKGYFWEDRVLPYVNKQWKVYLCPSVLIAGRDFIADSAASGRDGHIRTYAMNAYLGGYRPQSAAILGGSGGDFSYGPAMKAMQVRRPQSVTMFNDLGVCSFSCYYGGCFRNFTDCSPFHEVTYINKQTNGNFVPYIIWGVTQRIGKASWAFADGHAEKLKREFSNNQVLHNGSLMYTYMIPPESTIWVNPGHPEDLYGNLNWGSVS
jgi:prepilin-type processing-associated H-X9-DG protein